MGSIEIGDRVKVWLNGLTGIVTGMTEYLNGCRQALIQQETLDKDGKPFEGQWWDQQYCEIVQKQVCPNPFAMTKAATAGGPSGSTHRATR